MPRSNGETANREPSHDLQEILEHITSHVDVRVSAPMSSSVLGLHSAPRAHSGPAAGGSFGGGPRPAAPAGHPRPAAPVGYHGSHSAGGTCHRFQEKRILCVSPKTGPAQPARSGPYM